MRLVSTVQHSPRLWVFSTRQQVNLFVPVAPFAFWLGSCCFSKSGPCLHSGLLAVSWQATAYQAANQSPHPWSTIKPQKNMFITLYFLRNIMSAKAPACILLLSNTVCKPVPSNDIFVTSLVTEHPLLWCKWRNSEACKSWLMWLLFWRFGHFCWRNFLFIFF